MNTPWTWKEELTVEKELRMREISKLSFYVTLQRLYRLLGGNRTSSAIWSKMCRLRKKLGL